MATPPSPALGPAYRVSGLARPVDPRYPTNLAVLIASAVVFAAVFVAQWMDPAGGGDWGQALGAGVAATLLGFLAWATTRELSPDDNPAAFIAAGLALLAASRVGEQSLLILASTLMAARLVSRSTGRSPTLADSLIVTLAWGLLAYFVSWTCGVVGALALVLDAVLPSSLPARRMHALAALAVAAAIVARVVLGAGVAATHWPAHLPVWATLAGFGLIAAASYPRPRSVGDVDGQPLEPARVRSGLALGVVAAMLVSVDSGIRLQSVAGLWACVAAVALGIPRLWWIHRRMSTARTR